MSIDTVTAARGASSSLSSPLGTNDSGDSSKHAAEAVAAGVGEALRSAGLTIGVAESLTGGLLASTFAALKGASDFFRGGVVAYAAEVKFQVLGVTPGLVVNQRTADEMAVGAMRLFQADFAVGVTGVGGPDSEEGHPPGNVFVSVSCRDHPPLRAELQFPGDPKVVCRATCHACLDLVGRALARLAK
jgi:nicotinamide-nucleotide amidase